MDAAAQAEKIARGLHRPVWRRSGGLSDSCDSITVAPGMVWLRGVRQRITELVK